MSTRAILSIGVKSRIHDGKGVGALPSAVVVVLLVQAYPVTDFVSQGIFLPLD